MAVRPGITIEGKRASSVIRPQVSSTQARRDRFAASLASPDTSVSGSPTLNQLRSTLLSTPKSGNFGSPLPGGMTAPTSTGTNLLGNATMPGVVSQPPTTTSFAPTGQQIVPGDPGPLAPPSAPQGQSIQGLRDLSAAELDAALAAIESQYGLTREQLLQDQSELGATYRFLFSNLERQRTAMTQGATGEALQRGILRSGIHQGNIADVEQQYSEQTAQAEAAKQSRLFQINQALAALGPQQALAQAQASSQISGGQLALEQQLAALGQLANR